MQKILDVHIGEVKIAKRGEILKAILGSCVGIGIIWKDRKMCGLAHCLLAENPVPSFAIGGRFVDQAIRSLLSLMKVSDQDLKNLEVIIVGGGNMTGQVSSADSLLVGANNFKKAMLEAKKYDLHVSHSEYGEDEGRKIVIDASTCSYRVDKIQRMYEVS